MAELSDESDPESVSVSSSDDEEDNDGRGEGEAGKSLFSLMLSDEVKHEAKVQQDPEYDLPEELRVAPGVVLSVRHPGRGKAPVPDLGHGLDHLPGRPRLKPVLGGEPGPGVDTPVPVVLAVVVVVGVSVQTAVRVTGNVPLLLTCQAIAGT